MEVYLDNSATTRAYPEVGDIVYKAMCQDYGNPSSMHRKGVEAEHYVKDAKEILAKLLKVNTKEIFFTSGGTESDNLALIGVARANRRRGNHLITSSIEHPAILNTMRYLEEEEGFRVTYLPVDANGRVRLDALKESLYQTWKIENEKNEEIAALAHDIKIPLTIISGNTELLKCYSSDEYSLSHLQSIWGAVGKMEEYINLLIKYVKADRIDFHEKESMPCNSFSHKIVSEIKEYISGSEEIIKFNVEKVRGTIKIDYISLERAIFNIIDNAIEYKVYGDKIMCFIGQKDDSYIFTICNEKGEFSSQVLENGTKLFFTSNNNRNSIHYGIGLAYANKVIQSCEGELELYNSKEHGAVVSIKLPIT